MADLVWNSRNINDDIQRLSRQESTNVCAPRDFTKHNEGEAWTLVGAQTTKDRIERPNYHLLVVTSNDKLGWSVCYNGIC